MAHLVKARDTNAGARRSPTKPNRAPAVRDHTAAAAVIALQTTAGNTATSHLISVARQAPTKAPSARAAWFARQTIAELDGRQSKKVLISAVLNAKRAGELRAYAEILRNTRHADHGNYFIRLAREMEGDWGSKATVSILALFADEGVEISKDLDTSDLEPLAAVATFKSLLRRFTALAKSGDLSTDDQRRLREAIVKAESALRAVESPIRKPGPDVKMAGGVAMAAGAAWTAAAALAADDVTVVGIADDVLIPFVIVGAAVLSAIALFSGSGPQILNYGPAKAAVEVAIRQMTDLLAISSAMAIQGPRAAGQLTNVARHLARLLAVAAIGGVPSGEPPKNDNRDDNHWWKEIKASLKEFFQATKGASRKQIMRELTKAGFTEAQIAEIEAALAKAATTMGETIGKLLP